MEALHSSIPGCAGAEAGIVGCRRCPLVDRRAMVARCSERAGLAPGINAINLPGFGDFGRTPPGPQSTVAAKPLIRNARQPMVRATVARMVQAST